MRWTAALLMSVLACSDDGPAADPYKCIAAGGDACFQMPTDIVYATHADGAIVAPVLDCEPQPDTSTSGPLAGVTVDLLDGEQVVGGVQLQGFRDVELTDIMFDVTSGADGTWTATAADLPRHYFAVTRAPGQLDIHHLYNELGPAQPATSLRIGTATREQVASLLEGAGDRFLPGKTQLLGIATDCAGQPLGNVIANAAPVSARAGSRLFEPSVRTYYQLESTAPAFARRTEQWQTASSGGLAIANLAPGRHYIQIWGFRTENDLLYGAERIELLAEHPIDTFEGEAAIMMHIRN